MAVVKNILKKNYIKCRINKIKSQMEKGKISILKNILYGIEENLKTFVKQDEKIIRKNNTKNNK